MKGNKVASLMSFSESELQAELQRRRDEQEAESDRLAKLRAEFLYGKIDLLLELVPEHTPGEYRSQCDDKNPRNPGVCQRCALLEIKDQGYWDPEMELTLSLSGMRTWQSSSSNC